MKRVLILTAVFILIISGFGHAGVTGENSDPTTVLWLEDWEGNWSQDWHADGGTWEVGVPTSGPVSAHSGNQCAATILDGDYSEGVDSRLIRHTVFTVPSVSENPRLRFWQW